MAATSKVTSKGQIVIPKRLREKYGLRPSTSVRWCEQKDGILMIPETQDPIAAARGMLKGSGLLKAYLADKKKEREKERLKHAPRR